MEKDSYGTPKTRTSVVRELSDDELRKLDLQGKRTVMPFTAQKLEEDAQKHWDRFYKRNTTKFFKDRHWTIHEFQEFYGSKLERLSLLEIGCGVGNLIFPLIQECPTLQVFACDFSPRAVKFVQENKLYNSETMKAFQADITSCSLKNELNCFVDIATMVFVLSAIHPTKFECSFKNVWSCLKPGGVLLFRDYGLNDMTQIKFKPGHKISDNFYMRMDGTRTYFFSIDRLVNIALSAGFFNEECFYLHSRTINKKEGIDVPRVFIQAKFRKP